MPEYEVTTADQTALGDASTVTLVSESTIRERILVYMTAKLAEIRTSKGYRTECGATVEKAVSTHDPEDCPLVVLWPGVEEVRREYGKDAHTMEVRVEGLIAFGTANPSDISEKLYGDLVECVVGRKWSMPFTAGQTEILPGQRLTGATSGATARVESVTVTSGSWAGGDAAGTLMLRRKNGTFSGESLSVGDTTAVAQTTGVLAETKALTSTTDDLADGLRHTGGGPGSFPLPGELTVGAEAIFEVTYRTLAGNPYEQQS